MSPARKSAITAHVEAAKRLLDELEQQATTALDALSRDDTAEFTAAVDGRDRIISELSQVVDTLAQERLHGDDADDDADDAETSALLAQMEEAAASAMASQATLVQRTQQERDRLAVAIERTRPDAVANQYAAATPARRAATISVTG
jgi:preprotein translocase subunit SecD